MAEAFGLYTHIQSNRRRSILLIAGLFLLVYLMVFAGALAYEALAGGPTLEAMLTGAASDLVSSLPAVTIGTGLWVAIAYKAHQWIIDAVTDSHTVARSEMPDLYNLLENLCISRGMTMPQLKIMETPVLNAFASGMSEPQYAVTVTRGLIETLDKSELEAVLAHELTHIRNGDVRLMVIAVVIAGIVSFFAELMYRWFAYGPRVHYADEDSGSTRRASPAATALILAGVIVAVAWVLSGLLRFALSRSREYLADAGAVELTKNPDAMISALTKISGHAEIPGAPSGIMEMCIENQHSGFVDLFATHPPIEERITALMTHAGGQMPKAASRVPSFTRDTVYLDQHLGPWGKRA